MDVVNKVKPSWFSFSVRRRPWWFALLGAVLYFSVLLYFVQNRIQGLSQEALSELSIRHAKIVSLFQSSFYFFYEEQFLPGIKEHLELGSKKALIRRAVILTQFENGNPGGTILFDSQHPVPPTATGASTGGISTQKASPSISKQVLERLQFAPISSTSVFSQKLQVQILIPAGVYAVLYEINSQSIQLLLGFGIVIGLVLGSLMYWLLQSGRFSRYLTVVFSFFSKYWRLRVRFLFAIILINLITALIVFVTLVQLNTREQTLRIEKDSQLFGEFSTTEIISDFTNFFYFNLKDRFLPEIKRIIASNDNLINLKIISHRTGRILFNSEYIELSSFGRLSSLEDAQKVSFPPEVAEQLKLRDLVTYTQNKQDGKRLWVVNTYRNENQEPLFWVQYEFTYATLDKSVAAIRRQILIDLIPSLGLGLLIAVIFAQLLISPIRILVQALQRVTSGDYDISVNLQRSDEIGDLVGAFNSMTSELRKKNELRKYLSDSTYRQIMEAPESSEGIKLAGSRVHATVLFADIRNFVHHCETMDADEVTHMLNEYFEEMVEVVYKNGGEIDKFIGDALLAVFYASDEIKTIRPPENHNQKQVFQKDSASSALQAIYCAIEMRERLEDFNAKRKAQNLAVIDIGVGISFGEIISGPIGAKDRMDFTVIGDVVNLASRIEKLSKLGRHTKIVFSHHVEEKIKGLLDYDELTREKIRGKDEDVRVFELIGIRDLKRLIENIQGPDLDLRRRSVELLGQSRNLQALPWVIEATQNADELTQLQAVLAVGKLAPRNHEPSLNALFYLIQREISDKVISAAVSAIGKICDTNRILELTHLLDSSNDRIVANVIEAMGQVRSAKATDLILPKLNSRNNRVKANAAMAVFASGHIEVIDTLKPMLLHSDPAMRTSSAFAIGELTLIAAQEQLLDRWKTDPRAVKVFLAELQECVPMLVALLRDPDPMVRRQAVIALGKIKDKSAVLPMIEMVDPQNQSKELLRDVSQALRSIGSHQLVREVIHKLSS